MKYERTLVLVKPEGMKRHLVGEIIKRFERTGLKLVGAKMVQADEELISKHYPESMAEAIWAKAKEIMEKEGKTFTHTVESYGMARVRELRKHLVETPVMAIVLEGPSAIRCVRKLAGFTSADRADLGTIRGDLSCDSFELGNALKRPVRNIVHSSDAESAEKEIKLWFKASELFDWESAVQNAAYSAIE